MAYRQVSSGSNYVPSACDGIQVKISDKFIPPKKVTLPMKLETSFQQHNPSDVLFMEYDFSLEEGVIQWTEKYRASKAALNQAETNKVGDAIEIFTKQYADENFCEATDSDREETGGADSQGLTNGEHEEQYAPTENTTSTEGIDHGRLTQNPSNPFSLGTDILVPVQIPSKQGSSEKNNEGQKKINSINLADFEREGDPFDNAELRVLNDLEELNKVLQKAQTVNYPSNSCSTPQTDISQTNKTSSQHMASGMTNGGLPINQPYVPVSTSYQQTSIKEIDYPSLDSLESNRTNNSGQYENIAAPKASATTSNGLSYAFAPSYGYTPNNSYSNPPSKMVLSANPASLATNPFANSLTVSYNKQQDTVSGYIFPGHKPNHMQNNGIGSGNVNENQSTEFSFLSHGAGQYGKSGETSNRFGATNAQSLRSCKSVPDITGLSDYATIDRNVLPKSHTPPPNPRVQQAYLEGRRNSDFMKNYSFNGEIATNPAGALGNPWSNYPTKQSSTSSNASNLSHKSSLTSGPSELHRLTPAASHSTGGSTQPPKPASRLSDPYSGMSREEQRFVDSITGMGFPRDRVSRTVKNLGMDDQKVMDRLFLVTMFAEKGFFVGDVESAVCLFDKEEKIELYLKLQAQFRELGFSHSSIKDALVSSQLDENKTLDILTENT